MKEYMNNCRCKNTVESSSYFTLNDQELAELAREASKQWREATQELKNRGYVHCNEGDTNVFIKTVKVKV